MKECMESKCWECNYFQFSLHTKCRNVGNPNQYQGHRNVGKETRLYRHPPFPLNGHFEPVVLINHDIHPFDWEWNVMSSLFVN
jgi:hypothetical protein